MYGSPHIWTLSKTLTVTASLVLAFSFALSVYAGDLGAVDSATHGGKTIVAGETVYRSDFGSVTNNWTFNFSWPNSVGNTTAMLGIIRGTFGGIAGGVPQSGVNFDANFQAWPAGTNSVTKSIGIPPLGGLTAQSGVYTVLVAQTNGTFNQSGTMQWFASGGTAGQEPVNYKLLTFTYSATDISTQLPGSLTAVQYGMRSISEGDTVPQEDVAPNVENPSQYWRLSFVWPNPVPNQQALVAIFKGTYGTLDGGAPVSGVNYAANLQAWAAGANTIGKSMSLPGLESDGAVGTYTVLIAERDTKFSSASVEQEALWFSSGGTQGVAPRKYSTLTFTVTNPPKCCSSVLFLPGLKGSRLVYGSDTLWPPSTPDTFSGDIAQLALDSTGVSINDIKVDGVLEAFYSTPIYSGFTSYLDELVATDVIKDWEPLPYDWRLSPKRIVEDGVELQSGTLNLADEVERLANESYSEKVMIVAHSYGGLVAKALIAELQARGKDTLVESLVLVGSPQLGTPQAVASMLHGAGESIGLGYIVNPAASRQVSLNMESAYHLLPSQVYFSRVTDPVVTFDPNASFTEEWRSFWGSGITNYINFFGFVSGAGVTRIDPQPGILRIPEIGNPTLLTNANTYHTTYDSFEYPSHLKVVQIAGWGLPTVKSIKYTTDHFLQSYKSTETIEGDGTVIYPSAVIGGESYYFNLFDFNKLPESDFQHRDLLNAIEVQAIVNSILNLKSVVNSSFVTNNKPTVQDVDEQLKVSTFSPIVFGAYDSLGRFTGVDPNQDLSSELLSIKQEIPGSYFLEAGESNSIYLPSTGEYTFVVKGLSEGPASIEISSFSEASTTLTAQFKDFDVSSDFSGSFVVSATEPQEVQLASDVNGDGDTDLILISDLKKKPLTVTAKNKSIHLGAELPIFDAGLTGFIDSDTPTSSVTGSPECTSTATSTSTVGTYEITCTLGTLESSKYEFKTFEAGTLSITYDWSGFLRPINTPTQALSVFKGGTTVPVKFKLLNAEGESVQAGAPLLWVSPVQGDLLNEPRNERKKQKRPTKGDVFIWDSKQKQYVYNWNTKGAEKGYWYEIGVQLDDGTIRTIMIGLK